MAIERLRHLQRRFGLWPLLAIALLHLWEHSPIRHGRGGVLQRLYARFESVPAWLEAPLLAGPLLVYVGLGLRIALLERRVSASPSQLESRRNAALAMLVAGAFLGWHLGSVWVPARAGGGGVLLAVSRAEAQLDGMWAACAYVLGWSALCIAWGYAAAGLPAPDSGHAGARGRALAGLGLGLCVWFWGIDLLAVYVAGAGVF